MLYNVVNIIHLGVSMKQRRFWVILSLCLLLAIGVSGDTLVHKGNGQSSEPAVILASVSMQTDEKCLEVEPERIPISESQEEPLDVSEEQAEQDAQDILEEQILTLLTFNIHSANDQEGNVELEQIIEEIRETEAQLIGLQEVELNMPRSNYQDQARLIAEALGYHYYYGGNINILGVQYGNALLSKFPIVNSQNHKLPKKMLEPRGLIEAEVDVDGIPYYVYVTHLGLNPVERSLQIQYINEQLAQREGNILILGDFNNNPDSEEMQLLDSLMVDSAAALNKSELHTFSNWGDTAEERIDRIYVSDQIDLKNHEVKPSAVSDHRGAITQIVHKIQAGEGIYNALANKDNKGASLSVD